MEKRAFAFSAICLAATVGVAHAQNVRVMKTGLGEGTITASAGGIDCGTGRPVAGCNATGLSGTVTFTANFAAATSAFRGWGGDCASFGTAATCAIPVTAQLSVRANFRPIPDPDLATITDFSPAGIETFLNANRGIDTAAEFVAALPPEFRENWILMPRSESLQPGTATHPRVLLISADSTRVFTITLDPLPNPSYPAAHPNAIEYMQYVGAPDYNFHFHEIVLKEIPELVSPGLPTAIRHAARDRGPPPGDDPVKEDDPRCFNCHSTRNVQHRGGTTTEQLTPGTTGDPRRPPAEWIKFKTRPNWDTYDSWGGMVPFNRDRIYEGSLEAAAFRRLLNLWTWQDNDGARAVIEQLRLQPAGVPSNHEITRWDTAALGGGINDGHIQFAFDNGPEPISREPVPTGSPVRVRYSFDRRDRSAETGSDVLREPGPNAFLTLHHPCQPTNDEGRGVELFDRLTSGFSTEVPPTTPSCPVPADLTVKANPDRIADELISHRFATGSSPTDPRPIDVRPIALAIAIPNCITVVDGGPTTQNQTIAIAAPGIAGGVPAFFENRNGMSFNDVYDDTRRRGQSLPRRKADIEQLALNRDLDHYVYDPPPRGDAAVNGLIRAYGALTLGIGGPGGGLDQRVERLRQEIFRRAIEPSPSHPDETFMGRVYNDREDDTTDGRGDNTAPVALYRFFLEPLGVSVDKWSMGVRGRSRTYTFADILSNYPETFRAKLSASLGVSTCAAVLPLVQAEFGRLPAPTAVPTYTDMQRIFNKACIECHGGLGYPPYHSFGNTFDLTENENPGPGERRLWRSLQAARRRTGVPTCAPGVPTCTLGAGVDPLSSGIYRRITDGGNLVHPYTPRGDFNTIDPDVAPIDSADERCPGGLMPCEGPPLSKTDIETVRRWIIGGHPNTEGDPHIRTVDGVHYDFQSAGEFILLRGEGLELQARHTPVTTAAPVGPDAYTGLTSCVSINTAVALRVGLDRITYQPVIDEKQKQRRLQLRLNGKPVVLGPDGIALPSGGRIVRTSVAEGIEIHVPGGEGVVITPWLWDSYQVWYMNIEVRHARSLEGLMGVIPPGSWLPALSNGDHLGIKPTNPGQVYEDLHVTFAKSWRVDVTTSLFDYEPGLSPQTFVVEAWPASGDQQCVAPALPGGPVAQAAPAPIALAEAEQLCQGVADVERRANCVADVSATGERGFAKSYGATEALERRIMPGSATLVSPLDNAVLSAATPVELAWRPRPGAEVIDVVYRACIWNGDENFDFERCIKLPGGGGGGPGGSVIERLKARFGMLLWLVLLVLLLLVLLLIVRLRGKGALLAVLLVVVVLGVLLLLARARARTVKPQTNHVANVVPGKEYSWKVIAETRDGVFVESATYRFETGP